MGFTSQIQERHPGRDLDRETESGGRLLAFHEIRILDPLVGFRGARLGLVRVSRSYHRRVNELIFAAFRNQQLGVTQFHFHGIARHDVGDVHLENVRPMLFEQGRALAFRFRLFVGVPRFLARLDFRLQQMVADFHLHSVDGRPGRTRKHVGRFQRNAARVRVGLGHADIGDNTGDCGPDVGGFERHDVGTAFAAFDVEVGRQGFVGGSAGFAR